MHKLGPDVSVVKSNTDNNGKCKTWGDVDHTGRCKRKTCGDTDQKVDV